MSKFTRYNTKINSDLFDGKGKFVWYEGYPLAFLTAQGYCCLLASYDVLAKYPQFSASFGGLLGFDISSTNKLDILRAWREKVFGGPSDYDHHAVEEVLRKHCKPRFGEFRDDDGTWDKTNSLTYISQPESLRSMVVREVTVTVVRNYDLGGVLKKPKREATSNKEYRFTTKFWKSIEKFKWYLEQTKQTQFCIVRPVLFPVTTDYVCGVFHGGIPNVRQTNRPSYVVTPRYLRRYFTDFAEYFLIQLATFDRIEKQWVVRNTYNICHALPDYSLSGSVLIGAEDMKLSGGQDIFEQLDSMALTTAESLTAEDIESLALVNDAVRKADDSDRLRRLPNPLYEVLHDGKSLMQAVDELMTFARGAQLASKLDGEDYHTLRNYGIEFLGKRASLRSFWRDSSIVCTASDLSQVED